MRQSPQAALEGYGVLVNSVLTGNLCSSDNRPKVLLQPVQGPGQRIFGRFPVVAGRVVAAEAVGHPSIHLEIVGLVVPLELSFDLLHLVYRGASGLRGT